tara:strand:+ start:1812 stop:1988 length:177 start_codon:yes stop_codon:yes gene_type:complete
MTIRELIEYLKNCPQDNNAQISIDYEEEDRLGWYVDVIEVETVGNNTEIRAFIESEVK